MNVDNNIYEFPDAKGIVVSGDIHGDYEKLVYKCCLQCQMTDALIIVAGDCGFGFNKSGYYDAIYQKVSSRLAKANNWIVFIRGNHDNPAYFDGQQVNYKRWKAVPDNSVLNGETDEEFAEKFRYIKNVVARILQEEIITQETADKVCEYEEAEKRDDEYLARVKERREKSKIG